MPDYRRIILVSCVAFFILLCAGCTSKEAAGSPQSKGYDCKVIYDACGGVINSRATRTTYYQKDSYLLEPSGSSGMLIEPERAGYLLEGWYTNRTEITREDGSVSYAYSKEDKWDFLSDRVSGHLVLYARWYRQGRVIYYQAETEEVLFEKNISPEAGVEGLSSAVLLLVTPEGTELEGYYLDAKCTIPCDFDELGTGDAFEPSEEETEIKVYMNFVEVNEP